MRKKQTYLDDIKNQYQILDNLLDAQHYFLTKDSESI